MTKRNQFYISLVFLSFFAVLGLGPRKVVADDTYPDFWWDYGEVDEKHATYAPAMEREITRKTGVEIIAHEKRKVFVADEYIQIRFFIKVPFDVYIDENRLPEKLTPFEIAGFHFGQRKVIENDRDMELQELLLTLRLDSSFPYGTYVLPSFDLHYQYDTIVGNKHVPRKDRAATEEISLEKVPVYARAIQQRNTGFLWDTFPCLIEIHAVNSLNFLNIDQNSEADVLMQFKPSYPFVLQGITKSEFANDQYRVLRYKFMVAVQDFRNQPFTLAFPQIVWQQDGSSPESKNVITPESPVFFMKHITTGSTSINPMKRYLAEPQGERYRLLDLPFQMLWTIIAIGLFWLTFLIWQQHNQKKKDGKFFRSNKPVRPVYDRWIWRKVILSFLVIKARREFQKKPGPKRCAHLRELLARRVALGLPAKYKLTIAEVCALTAAELLRLGGREQDVAELIQLEHHLESGQYKKMRDSSWEGAE